MNSIENNKYCCGCEACANVCPKGAIKIMQNEEGFYSAFVNDKCISCGKCLKVCPINQYKRTFNDVKRVYAAISKNQEDLRRSSSGGLFSAIAKNVLSKQGVVYGCAQENMINKHIKIENVTQLDKIRRSKYVQSDIRGVYKSIKKDLEKGILVLFSGTPCQVSGLRLFLGKDYLNLYCVDIICHGVPSPLMFELNKKYLEKKYKQKLEAYEFREKSMPEKPFYYYYYYFSHKVVNGPYYKDPYYEAFYNFNSYNEICYQCNFACEQRTGDITLGDYSWATKYHTELKEKYPKYNTSISCMLVNSNKGIKVCEEIKDNILLLPTQFDWVAENNKNLLRPTPRPLYRNNIYKIIRKDGYEKWVHGYFKTLEHLKNTDFYKKIRTIKHVFLN